MAVRVPTINYGASAYAGNRAALVTWSGLTNATSDTGTPFALSDYDGASVQVSGTFGVGGTIVLEGSNDNVTYTTLKDIAGAAISLTAAGQVVLQSTAFLFVRPRITAGDGTTSLVAAMLVRASNQF